MLIFVQILLQTKCYFSKMKVMFRINMEIVPYSLFDIIPYKQGNFLTITQEIMISLMFLSVD